jgi:hypothetical protein
MFSITFGTPWYITFITALAGVIVGGFITFFITHAKTRSEIKWKLKQEAYMAIINDVDQAVTNQGKNINESKRNRRRAKHLIKLAFGQSDITTIANKILDRIGGMSVAEIQEAIDNELMPKVESDLEETIRDWWKIWK